MALISPPGSPELSPINGEFKNGLDHEKVQLYSEEEIQSPEPTVRENFIDFHKYFKSLRKIFEFVSYVFVSYHFVDSYFSKF